MTLSLFSQFESPQLMGIPLIALALTLPWLPLPQPSGRWVENPIVTLLGWANKNFTKQTLQPLNLAGHKWALLFTSLMIFLIMSNLLGLLPYTFTPTTQLSLNMALSAPLWLATVVIGMRNQPTRTLAHLLPENTPPLLIPVLIVIETISLLIRPLALGVRLTANLTAGHLLIHLIASATFVATYLIPLAAVFTFILLLLLTLLEIAVAMIQAYVFVLLVSLYLQENI
nr:ATP synthase protein 6 [Pholidichthys leucotaenia]